jgi:hypothetical protein
MKLQRPEKFNIPLAEKVLDHVIKFPDLHKQDTVGAYTCNSPGCIAGWVRFFAATAKERETVMIETLTQDKLGIYADEFHNFFGDGDEASAIETLADYIAQARAAQTTQDDYELHTNENKELIYA